MPDSAVLDVVFGLSFVFFVLAVFASAINEALAALLRTRSLEGWVTDNLITPPTGGSQVSPDTVSHATNLANRIFAHPL
jgi:hypothetical protein